MVVSRRHAEAGYALLATLWICMGIGALTWLISVSAREAMATSRNRMELARAEWHAQACLAYARELLRDVFSREVATMWDSVVTSWHHIDRVLAAAPQPVANCELSARAIGSRLDVNASGETTIAQVLQAAGMPAAQADSAAAALADWKDPDDEVRPNGAERAWYVAHGLRPPSNTFVADRRELRRVRGLESFARLDSVFDVEPGPLSLNQAPAEVLALLPGFTERTIAEVVAARARETPIMSFYALSQLLSKDDPEASAKLPGLILLMPSAWVITARVTSGAPAVTSVVEIRIARGANTTFITRRRSWVE